MHCLFFSTEYNVLFVNGYISFLKARIKHLNPSNLKRSFSNSNQSKKIKVFKIIK